MKLFDSLLQNILNRIGKAFISIIEINNKYYIKVKVVGKNKSVENKVFSKAGDNPPIAMAHYIAKIQKKYSYSYVATLLSTINAGAIPLCGDIDYKKYKIECEDIARICINDSWTAYTNRYVLIDLKKYYEKVCDLDFIFPTEAILHFLIKDYAESNENILYILHTNIFTNITIFKNKKLPFSSRFIYQNDEDVDTIDEEDVKDIIGDLDQALAKA